jgi:oleate hydratase
LSILSCLDITGYYQHESIFLPIFLHLQSINVDYRFNTKVNDLVLNDNNRQLSIEKLQIVQDGFHWFKKLGKDDIVILTIGSSVSGSTTGAHDHPPVWQSNEMAESLDENWSLWLSLASRKGPFGNPYDFCTRQSESVLESFTITTEDGNFFGYLRAISRCGSETGAFITLQESQWGINLCVPVQPVFSDQPQNVRVIWGFATSPARRGDYLAKPMLQCSGREIMTEILRHLNMQAMPLHQNTVTIPRIMPRMTASLLARVPSERPVVIPKDTCNIGLVGQFVEIPQFSSVDVSYGVRTAKLAVSRLMGLGTEQERSPKQPKPPIAALCIGSFWQG